MFDSGVGGISVLAAHTKVMPNEDFIYYGDSANAPYGEKSASEVRTVAGAVTEKLLRMGAKAIVIACNTATSAAVRILRIEESELVIVGIEPAIKPPSVDFDHPRVLVMATPLTLKEEKFKSLVARFSDAEEIIPLPCPRLVDFVERGELDSPLLEDYLEDLLSPYKNEKIDALVLGCTHYPHIKSAIARHLPPSTKIYDGGEGTARETRRRLSELNLLNPGQEKGRIEIINSSGDERLIKLSEMLLYR